MEAQTLTTAIARRRFLWVVAATAGSVLAAAAGCADRPNAVTDSEIATVTGVNGGSPDRFVRAVDRTAVGDPAGARTALSGFGADLLRTVHGTEPNTLISPYSIYTVLAMARAGAQGDTAAQLDAALRLEGAPAQGAAVAAIDAGIADALDAAQRVQQPATITASNEVWIADGLAVRQDYLDQLAREFAVSAVAADFAGQPEQMRQAINSWVSTRTNSLIPELLPAGSIDPGTLLVLVNALYLKALWESPFGPPRPGSFTTGTGAKISVPMMSSKAQGASAADGGWSAATVRYAGQGLQMTLLVPDPGQFDTVLADLGPDLMALSSGVDDDILLTMPPFGITSTPDVQRGVVELGVVDLFGPEADLTGITGEPGELFATAFVHQARITVDENGTEAAAATAMRLAGSAAPAKPPRVLTINRPFIFWIAETATGAPLFLGTVTDPS